MSMNLPVFAAACVLAVSAVAAAQERSPDPQQPQATLAQAEAGAMDESQVQSAIEAHGYTNVRDIERNGEQYIAIAERDGEDVVVVVDARTGAITEATN
ncbi:MAG: hypothetical protein EA405_09775 [Rhodospirillales bacterium]|nr:MAG: hypothetical protein EA405_09775 [Rhodospirillales bacterium]